MNKKGGVASEEILGYLVFVLSVIFMIFGFAACNAYDVKDKQNKLQVSTLELEATQDLTFFLKSSISNKSAIQILEQSYKDDDYSIFQSAAEKYFQKYSNWNLKVYERDNELFTYKTTMMAFKAPSLKKPTEIEQKIPISIENKVIELTIVLQVR